MAELRSVCGPPPTPHGRNTSTVLLIGDSISMGALESLGGDEMGYGAAVSRMLDRMGRVDVQHNGGWSDAGQAGPSSKGVQCIRHWLGTQQWDVVHANFGLHDIAKARGSSWRAVPPVEYVKNLDAIFRHVQAALKPGGQFVWATTTPVPESLRLAGAAPGSALSRNNSQVVEYNRLAADLWASKWPGAVVINDLYGLVTKRCGRRGRYGSFYRCALQRLWPSPEDADVHFNEEGREYLALAVASVIAQQLPCLHQARPHAAVAATAEAARRGGRKAHHSGKIPRRRRLAETQPAQPQHASGSARSHLGRGRAPPRMMRVACVGDSLTRGDGSHLGPSRSRIALFGNYPRRLQLALSGGGGGDRSVGGAPMEEVAREGAAGAWLVRNFGRGGSTAIAGNQTAACHGYAGGGTGTHTRAYLGSAEYNAALRLSPHVVLVMLGTNDSTEPCWDGEAFSRGLQDLVAAFRGLPSRPAVALLVPPVRRRLLENTRPHSLTSAYGRACTR